MATEDKRPARVAGQGLAEALRQRGLDANLLRLLLIMVLILLGMSLARPQTFPTLQNFQSMSGQFPEIGIVAIAIMITMLTGGIDLSVIGVANLCGILAALFLTRLAGPEAGGALGYTAVLAGVGLALAVGALCGLVNGLLIALVGITPILATLGTMTLFTGIGLAITNGSAVFAIPQFLFLGGSLLGLPVPLLLFVGAALIFSLLLNRTSFGFRLYLLGTNATAARFSGLNNRRILVWTYVLSGVLAALAGIIFLARNNSAKADYASSYVLQAILVCILGGVNPNGGFGRISGLVLAILGLQFLSTGLNMLLLTYNGSNFFKEFAWGALLLLVMVIDYNPRRSRVRRAAEVATSSVGPPPE